jgi:hypothetical protein
MKAVRITWNPETLVDAIGWDGIDKEASIERYENQVAVELKCYYDVEFMHSHVDKESFDFYDEYGNPEPDNVQSGNVEYIMQDVFSRFDWAVDRD